MATTDKLVTADELLEMPEITCRYELVRGELRSRPFVGHVQGRIATNVLTSLYTHAKSNGLGEALPVTGFILALRPDHVRAPSVAFVRRARVDAVADVEGFFPGPPDLAVEVVSPDDLYMDVYERIADYLAAGILAVIVVDPSRRVVKVHRSRGNTVELGEGDTLEVDDVVPGCRLEVGEMFE